MGHIISATSVYSVAYLTELGRAILFNEDGVSRFDASGEDLFDIRYFTLADQDTNYHTDTLLSSGGVPNITGSNEDGSIKAASNIVQRNLVCYDGKLDTGFGLSTSNDNLAYIYDTDVSPDDELIIDVNLIPTT